MKNFIYLCAFCSSLVMSHTVVANDQTSVIDVNTINSKKYNSPACLMAVQILLESQGYDVGKIDGIFRSKNQTESNTMKAIKKFQREHGLTPNGIINKATVQALLE